MPYSTVVMVRNALYPADWQDGNPPDEGTPTFSAADMLNEQLIDAIAQADSIIDSYIGGRYVVPVLVDATGITYATTPHPLDFWSRDLAAYFATLTNRQSQDFTDNDPVARRYNAAMLALTGVRDGKAVLSIPTNVGPSAMTGVGTVVNPYQGNLFGPCDFDLWNPWSPSLYPGMPG